MDPSSCMLGKSYNKYLHGLGDIVILVLAIHPCSLLTHVAISTMPFINSIKKLIPRNDNSSNFAIVDPSNDGTWFCYSRNLYVLNVILMDVIVPYMVLAMKYNQLIPLNSICHELCLDTDLPILDDIHNVVHFCLWPAC